MGASLALRVERRVLDNVIRLCCIRGESERVACGFALGLAVNFFPTFGFGVLISGFVARVFGGNAAGGLVGGATLTFVWPLLFYLNLRTGSLFHRPPMVIDELEDVTETVIDALVWGQTFTIGAGISAVLATLVVYLVLRLIYDQTRPGVLAYFRHHARDHQRRFSRCRGRF